MIKEGINEDQQVILFADVCDSTKIYQHLGDEKTQALIAEGLKIMGEIVADHYGKVVKTIGDELMAVFSEPDYAVDSALLMLNLLKQSELAGNPGGTLRIKIGMHYGSVIQKDKDYFGNTVNAAARVVAQSKESQILITQAVLDKLKREHRERVRQIDRLNLKGLKEHFDLFEVLTADDPSGITVASFDHLSGSLNDGKMTLQCHGKKLVLDISKTAATLGRNLDNDLVVPVTSASRVHAIVEFKNGKFFLKDQSLNGTYIYTKSGPLRYVRREEVALEKKGFIALGQEMPESDLMIIQFERTQ